VADTDTLIRRLTARVEQLEAAERRRAASVPVGRTTTLARNRPPKISGLASQPVPGQIGARWTPSSIPDLAAYEVQISDNASFAGAVTTLQRTEAFFTLAVADPAAPHWIRVRARSQSTGTGDWSDKLELVSGQVVAADMSPDAATSVSRNRVEIFDPPILDSDGVQGPTEAEYGDALASTYNGVVFIWVRLFYDYDATSITDPWSIESALLRDGVPTGDADVVSANTASAGSLTLGGALATPDEPGAGDFTYSVRLRLFGTPTNSRIILVPRFLEIELVEFMRARG
jgi:hypothetical protein